MQRATKARAPHARPAKKSHYSDVRMPVWRANVDRKQGVRRPPLTASFSCAAGPSRCSDCRELDISKRILGAVVMGDPKHRGVQTTRTPARRKPLRSFASKAASYQKTAPAWGLGGLDRWGGPWRYRAGCSAFRPSTPDRLNLFHPGVCLKSDRRGTGNRPSIQR
jgi:hypothetical protein